MVGVWWLLLLLIGWCRLVGVVGCCWLVLLFVLLVVGEVNWLMAVGCCCWLVLVVFAVVVQCCVLLLLIG